MWCLVVIIFICVVCANRCREICRLLFTFCSSWLSSSPLFVWNVDVFSCRYSSSHSCSRASSSSRWFWAWMFRSISEMFFSASL